MRFIIIIFLSFLFPKQFCTAQNIVSNGDFEQYIGCPTAHTQMDSVNFWYTPTLGTPDYFNVCGSGYANVPNTSSGYQNARSGLGFVGSINYVSIASNLREYLSVKLLQPLVIGNCYYFEMYVNRGNNSEYTTNSIGAYFSNAPTHSTHSSTFSFTPQIMDTTVNIDTLNWTKISGTFQSQGGEEYLTIGVFKDDNNAGIIQTGVTAGYFGAYMNFDDVSLTKMDSYDCAPIAVKDYDLINSKIYPNPFTNSFSVDVKTDKECVLFLYDLWGRIVKEEKVKSSTLVKGAELKSGLYFYEILSNGNKIGQGKLIKE